MQVKLGLEKISIKKKMLFLRSNALIKPTWAFYLNRLGRSAASILFSNPRSAERRTLYFMNILCVCVYLYECTSLAHML